MMCFKKYKLIIKNSKNREIVQLEMEYILILFLEMISFLNEMIELYIKLYNILVSNYVQFLNYY